MTELPLSDRRPVEPSEPPERPHQSPSPPLLFHSPPTKRSVARSKRTASRLTGRLAWSSTLSLTIFCILASSLSAQGLLIPENNEVPTPLPRSVVQVRPNPAASYRIKEFLVQANIDDQVAQTQVTQTFVNTGNRTIEASLIFPLPYDGAIDRLTFMVGNDEYDAKLIPAKEARRIYEGYVRRNQDPALLEWLGQGMFKTSVFPIPPGEERKVTLRYTQVLQKNFQLTDYLFPLSTGQYSSHPIENLTFNASIESRGKLKNVYSPSHEMKVERRGEHRAKVSFAAQHAIPVSDFRLFFDTADSEVGASLLSYWPEGDDHGYFLLLASPEIESSTSVVPRKAVVLVADRSGSMSGTKMEQTKKALQFVVNNLNENDLFNIIAYDSSVETFSPELKAFDDKSRQAALGFIEDIFANGSTNIEGALSTALAQLKGQELPSYVVFMTDGLPTAGTTDEMQIVQKTKELNRGHVRLINLGVGYDVNSRLLDRLSQAHRGQSEFVRPNEDLEAYVSRLYQRISSPVMTSLDVEFSNQQGDGLVGSLVNRTYPNPLPDLFRGEQLILAGRYRKAGEVSIEMKGDVGDQLSSIEFSGELASTSSTANFAFVEKIWASRRIGEIINEIDLNGKNEELIKELISLSTRHGIMTPYTSFLADDLAHGVLSSEAKAVRFRAADSLSILGESDGRQGFDLRAEKKVLQDASSTTNPAFAQPPGGAQSISNRSGGSASSSSAISNAYGGGRGGEVQEEAELARANRVETIGSQTLFRSGQLWIAANASGVDPVADADKIKTIERFSEEYFELIKDNSKDENEVFAKQPEKVDLLIRLRGQLYRIH